jgi:transposase-like protein
VMSRDCIRCGSGCSGSKNYGYFIRRSDKKKLLRYLCRECGLSFSQATFQSCYRQKKRRLNPRILELLCSGVSQRRIAILLKINRKTVARKLIFLATRARAHNEKTLRSLRGVEHVQFDDLETIEHTKCKPLSVTMAVEKISRRILAFNVSQMPAKGYLAKISFKKYGMREDKRAFGRKTVFEKLAPLLASHAVIESDQNPHYLEDVKRYFPKATHIAYLGQRGSISGQGELKKIKFDPLFSLNHTFAMLRANINRLFRKTWCTTKLPQRLSDHIEIFALFHNEVLIHKPT